MTKHVIFILSMIPCTIQRATGGPSEIETKARDALRFTIFPHLGSLRLCDSYDANRCLNFSAITEPVIWAGLGEGSLISEDHFWDGLLSHILGKLVLAVSQLGHAWLLAAPCLS